MSRKLFLLGALLILLELFSEVFALTDPEPNPFLATEVNQVYEGKIVKNENATFVVENIEGEEFSGAFTELAKYRDGGGVAEAREFFVGDRVRFAVSEKKMIAVQNSNLLLCDQNFVGRVQNLTSENFELTTFSGTTYRVHLGENTLFRDEATKDLLFDEKLANDTFVRVHGVVNTNVQEIFTATFGAYIAPFSELQFTKLKTEYEDTHPFRDIAEDTPYRDAIAFVKKQNIVGGYPDGTFAPERTINRAEFTKILLVAKFGATLDEVSESENCFTDFKREEWFAKYVCRAKKEEILGGYADGTFRPAQNINLAEAVKIVLTTFHNSQLSNLNSQLSTPWYAPYLARAEELELLPEGLTDPAHLVTRGEMAELVRRVME